MSKSILLADDSATIRKVVELTFGESGFHVEAVGSGREALERLDVLRPDVVLADVVMPAPTGYEICRHIKASDRPVPVLLLAGTFEAFDHDEARECGADGCLLKPFEGRTLVDRVNSLLADREAVSTGPVEAFETVETGETVEPLPEPPPPEAPAETGRTRETPPLEQQPERTATSSLPRLPRSRPELSSREIEAIADAVVRRLSDAVVREIAERVVPRVAENVVRERIRELESEDA